MEIFQTSEGFPFEYPQFLMAFCNRVKFGSVIFSLGVAAYMESVEGGLSRWGARSHLDPVPWGQSQSQCGRLGNRGLSRLILKRSWKYSSQGHSKMTALSHYLGLPFAQVDKGAMLEHASGWA